MRLPIRLQIVYLESVSSEFVIKKGLENIDFYKFPFPFYRAKKKDAVVQYGKKGIRCSGFYGF